MDGGMYYGVTMDFAKRYSLGFHAGSGFTDDNIYTVYITLGYKL
jgi:predicted GIY-YIG superfamily endonuclease